MKFADIQVPQNMRVHPVYLEMVCRDVRNHEIQREAAEILRIGSVRPLTPEEAKKANTLAEEFRGRLPRNLFLTMLLNYVQPQ